MDKFSLNSSYSFCSLSSFAFSRSLSIISTFPISRSTTAWLAASNFVSTAWFFSITASCPFSSFCFSSMGLSHVSIPASMIRSNSLISSQPSVISSDCCSFSVCRFSSRWFTSCCWFLCSCCCSGMSCCSWCTFVSTCLFFLYTHFPSSYLRTSLLPFLCSTNNNKLSRYFLFIISLNDFHKNCFFLIIVIFGQKKGPSPE